jgi:hypothetical protein
MQPGKAMLAMALCVAMAGCIGMEADGGDWNDPLIGQSQRGLTTNEYIGIGITPGFPLTIGPGVAYSSFGKTKYVKAMINGNNDTGGGIAVSDDGGFFDWNDGYLTYEPLCCGQGLKVNSPLTVTGNLYVSGAKAFVHPHPQNTSQDIVYIALEGPEAGTYIRGTGRLHRGQAKIALPEHFSAVTASEGITVQLTCLGECKGLRVADKSPGHIVVKELMSGEHDVAFDYLVQGVRKGYERFDPLKWRQAGGPGEDFEAH